jgi:hypothetical protein
MNCFLFKKTNRKNYFLPTIRQFSLGEDGYKTNIGGSKSSFLELNDNGKSLFHY